MALQDDVNKLKIDMAVQEERMCKVTDALDINTKLTQAIRDDVRDLKAQRQTFWKLAAIIGPVATAVAAYAAKLGGIV